MIMAWLMVWNNENALPEHPINHAVGYTIEMAVPTSRNKCKLFTLYFLSIKGSADTAKWWRMLVVPPEPESAKLEAGP